MTPRRKRPRGFYARLARARGVPLRTVYYELNPDKRPCARAAQECDARPPWSRLELIHMDRAFCDAVAREIARGTERARPPAALPGAASAQRRFRSASRRAGASSAAADRRPDGGERDRVS